VIGLIKSLHRTFKRGRHLRAGRVRLSPYRLAIESACGGPVRFAGGSGGGHDYIFCVTRGPCPVAMLRIANPDYVPDGTPLADRLNGPRIRLTPRERIARERRLCAAGCAQGLAPQPLWLAENGEAFLNAYVDGLRLFDWVQRGALPLWDAIELAARHANRFHAVVGEAHMDLSLFNVIADASLARLTFIDFELAPSPALTLAESRLFDFLNLVEMAYKFMSRADRAAAPQRLGRLLSEIVPADVRAAPAARLTAKLPRLAGDPALGGLLSLPLISSPSTGACLEP